MATFARVFLVLVLAAGLTGCFVFNELERPTPDSGSNPDGKVPNECDVGPEQGKLPCRPPASTSLPTDTSEVTFAIKKVRIKQDESDPDGLDLDGYDSSAGSGSEGVGECTSAPLGVDGPNGIDNTLGIELWNNIASNFNLECEIERVHRKGQGTILINIQKWNGLADDAQVDVFIAPAVLGTYQPTWTRELAEQAKNAWTWGREPVEITYGDFSANVEIPFAEDDGERVPEPCWLEDGSQADWYFANPRAFSVPPVQVPNVRSTTAYVSNNWLVMPLPLNSSFDLYTDRRGLQVRLTYAYLVAKISEDRSHFERAFVAGRFAMPDLIDVSPAIGFCAPETFAGVYASFTDLYADPETERPRSSPCHSEELGIVGALSMGVGFEAVRVSYAGIAPNEAAWDLINACETFDENSPDNPTECPGDVSYTFTPPAHCPN